MLLALAVVTAAAGSAGCWGSFSLTNKLYRFNDGVSDSKWIKWLLFLGLIILPVYSLFILGDAIIFNTIEFFTGSNPFGGGEGGGSGGSKSGGGGDTPILSPSKEEKKEPEKKEPEKKEPPKKKKGTITQPDPTDPNLVRIDLSDEEGRTVEVFYVRRRGDDEMTLLDRERRVVFEVREQQGVVTLRDGRGRTLARIGRESFRKMAARLEKIGSPRRTLGEMLDERDAPLLAARARSSTVM
jgi:hypothetical protein